MQLGELQNQIARFERRGVNIVALSVDKPAESTALIERLGLTYVLASDAEQTMIDAFRVRNPDTQELAIHAVYIVAGDGKIFYRKVARRRPESAELIDAIDAYRGVYPQDDAANPRRRTNVAYPTNDFQAILEVARVRALPTGIDAQHYAKVEQLARQIHSDDALIAWRELMRAHADLALDDLLDTASWIARRIYFDETHAAVALGRELRGRLDRVAALEERAAAGDREATRDDLIEARALLQRTRVKVENNAREWRLRLLKTSIRSYREVAKAAKRDANA